MVEAASILASAVVIGSGIVVWALLQWVKTFGDYAVKQDKVVELLMTIHESNQILAGQNQRILDAQRQAKTNGQQKGVA